MSDEALVARIHAAVTEATRRYLADRRARVGIFTRQHFSVRGALRINRHALGKDLLRTPANVLWIIPHLLAQGGAVLGRKLRLNKIAQRLEYLLAGFKTDVEREVEWLIYSELLELPFEQGGRRCSRDALLEEILAHPTIGELLVPELIRLDQLSHRENFRQRLENYLITYTNSRTAAVDLSGSLLSLAAGVVEEFCQVVGWHDVGAVWRGGDTAKRAGFANFGVAVRVAAHEQVALASQGLVRGAEWSN